MKTRHYDLTGGAAFNISRALGGDAFLPVTRVSWIRRLLRRWFSRASCQAWLPLIAVLPALTIILIGIMVVALFLGPMIVKAHEMVMRGRRQGRREGAKICPVCEYGWNERRCDCCGFTGEGKP